MFSEIAQRPAKGTTFRLHGQLVAIGEALARLSGMTSASQQVLAAVLRSPLPVADSAREIGVRRQSVQRVADLQRRGLASRRTMAGAASSSISATGPGRCRQ